jgi:hypothetical protein
MPKPNHEHGQSRRRAHGDIGMKEVAAGLAIGAMVAMVIAGGVVASLEVWGHDKGKSRPTHPPVSTVVRIGPDGTARTTFGDDVRNAILRDSQRFAFCYGDMRVGRPSMMTTDMPDAFCTVSRQGNRGQWQFTGGWQQPGCLLQGGEADRQGCKRKRPGPGPGRFEIWGKPGRRPAQ